MNDIAFASDSSCRFRESKYAFRRGSIRLYWDSVISRSIAWIASMILEVAITIFTPRRTLNYLEFRYYIHVTELNWSTHCSVKQHNITGLKYLGQTTKDPYTYKGSGVHWCNHLKVHGNDVSTEIIGTYETKEELKVAGIYYSDMWNVEASDDWANLWEEAGMGRPPIGRKAMSDAERQARFRRAHKPPTIKDKLANAEARIVALETELKELKRKSRQPQP